MEQKRATCIEIVPSEIIQEADRRNSEGLPEYPEPTNEQRTRQQQAVKSMENTIVAIDIIVIVGVSSLVGFLAYKLVKS